MNECTCVALSKCMIELCIGAYVCVYMYVCVCVCECMCACTYALECMVSMCVCMWGVCVCVCLCGCMNLFNCAKQRGCVSSHLFLLLTQSAKTKSVNSYFTDFNQILTLPVSKIFLPEKMKKLYALKMKKN